MEISETLMQELIIKELKHEARMSDRQIRMLEWGQLRNGKVKTWRNREVILSPELYNAIASLPVKGRRVFGTISHSPLAEMPEPPVRHEEPVAEDDKAKLARLIAEKLLA